MRHARTVTSSSPGGLHQCAVASGDAGRPGAPRSHIPRRLDLSALLDDRLRTALVGLPFRGGRRRALGTRVQRLCTRRRL